MKRVAILGSREGGWKTTFSSGASIGWTSLACRWFENFDKIFWRSGASLSNSHARVDRVTARLSAKKTGSGTAILVPFWDAAECGARRAELRCLFAGLFSFFRYAAVRALGARGARNAPTSGAGFCLSSTKPAPPQRSHCPGTPPKAECISSGIPRAVTGVHWEICREPSALTFGARYAGRSNPYHTMRFLVDAESRQAGTPAVGSQSRTAEN